MTPLERIRLEKAAANCGFERMPEPTEDGVLVSKALSAKACEQLGVSRQWAVERLTNSHHGYLGHHRKQAFQNLIS